MSTESAAGLRVNDIAASLIRTWVPIGVGALLTWIAAATDTVISPEMSASAGAYAAMLTAAGYYGVARLLEASRGHSRVAGAMRTVGRFMLGGVAKKPSYLSDVEFKRLQDLSAGPRHAAR